ncbi:MAG: hypothetical protein B7Z43_10025 [Sphingomonas sp. 12-62-6]|nr:MAG: hypothetical protein B7Z43_10025 [Sphingomonas sp. 12-62-6]
MTADRNARLVVRCDRVAEPVVSIQMRIRAGIAAAPDHAVSVGIDGGAPIVTPWEFPGTAIMNRATAAVTQLTVAMNGAKTISIATTDGESPVSLTFDGLNGGGGIKDVLTACGYEFGVVPKPVKAER